MSSRTAAELSSLESQLDQLIARVGTLARAAEPGRRDLIVTLHEVERALREARRQTAQATRLV
jgi:hypothetical protein